jgi:NAD(P)-dependent dehydrogenase (short-subunit alcohol dehydrogenase family)
MGRLDGKTVLVIGGAQGIGRGCVLSAAGEGANLVIGDLRAEGARSTAEEATARGARAIGMTVDVTDKEQVDAMVTRALDEFGAIDGLVNLAFYPTERTPLAEMPLEQLGHELQVDVVGCLLAMQAVHPHLRHRGGSIVNFSSGAGVIGVPGLAGYSAAKAAIRLLSRVAALEWGTENVRVNAVCPYSMSPTYDAAIEREHLDPAALSAYVPLGRIGDAEADIGPGVVFLLSDDARYVTGQTMAFDGGVLAL